jgi:hypothetical protein
VDGCRERQAGSDLPANGSPRGPGPGGSHGDHDLGGRHHDRVRPVRSRAREREPGRRPRRRRHPAPRVRPAHRATRDAAR